MPTKPPLRRPVPAAASGARPIPLRPGETPAGSRASGGAIQTTVRTEAAGEEEAVDAELSKVREAVPPWLVSAVLHATLLVVLGLIVLKVQFPTKPPIVIQPPDPPDVWAEQIGKQVVDDSAMFDVEKPVEKQVVSQSTEPPVDDPFAAPPEMPTTTSGLQGATSEVKAPDVGMALTGRQQGKRGDLMAAYGGNKKTEDAVLLALAWLARQQAADGSWSLKGPYGSVAFEENKVAATAMALLAFQGHGETHLKGEYQTTVDKGWRWMFKQFHESGSFFEKQNISRHQKLYTQGLAMIALCELYGMTEDSALREPAQRVVDYACKIQDKLGGWRYEPLDDSDLSVSGWFMMGLQSARMAKLNVPPETLYRLSALLDKLALEGGSQYDYQISARKSTPAMSAEGLLCRQYLGWKQHDPRMKQGAEYLLANHPMEWREFKRNVYYWYYATQVLHHLEGDAWRRWNAVMRQMLPTRQVKEGKERGSWDPEGDVWASSGGRLYVTCLSTYMLEVYYRHLPIYSGNLWTPPAPPSTTPSTPPNATPPHTPAVPAKPQ